jgi:hypothetical protein
MRSLLSHLLPLPSLTPTIIFIPYESKFFASACLLLHREFALVAVLRILDPACSEQNIGAITSILKCQ